MSNNSLKNLRNDEIFNKNDTVKISIFVLQTFTEDEVLANNIYF